MVLHLDTTAISNQIKYCLTTNRGNFLEMQYGFYKYALLADLIWLVVERTFMKNSRKAGTWLFGASLWKIIKSLWLVKYSSKFVFIDRRSWNSQCPRQGCGMHQYLSWLDSQNKYTDTEPGAISNPFESFQKFQGKPAFWFTYKVSWKSNIA